MPEILSVSKLLGTQNSYPMLSKIREESKESEWFSVSLDEPAGKLRVLARKSHASLVRNHRAYVAGSVVSARDVTRVSPQVIYQSLKSFNI